MTAESAPPLTEDVVVKILTERTINNSKMAKLLGIHREVVRRVRVGMRYSYIRPDIPRWKPPKKNVKHLSCWNCIHGSFAMVPRVDCPSSSRRVVACGFGLPDTLVHGAKFARDCALYVAKEDGAGPA